MTTRKKDNIFVLALFAAIAVKLSRATFSKIKQNLFWAFIYNTVTIPFAIVGLLHPVIAEIAMATSSISVVTNANMLRRVGIQPNKNNIGLHKEV